MMDGDDEDDEVAVLPPSSSSSPMKMKEQQPLPRWYRRFLRSAPLIASVRQGGRRALAATTTTTTTTTMTSNRNNSSGDVSGRRTTRDIKVTIRCNYMIDDRKINDTLLENNDDEDVITRPGTNDEKNVMIRPEMAVSNNSINSNAAECCTPRINKEEYALLHSRYLQPRTRTNVELPASGMILRKQTKCRWIDQYKELRILKIKIDTLLKNNEHSTVYTLLCQLRDWEMNPRCIPCAFIVRQQQDTDEDVVTEILDLTNDEDDDNTRGSDCIDVDECTTDIVLARPLDILSSSSITLHTPPPKQQKKQPSIGRQLMIKDCRDFHVQRQQQQQPQQQQEPKHLLFQIVDDDRINAQPSSCVVTPEKDFAGQKDEIVMNKIFLDTNLEKRKLHPCPTTEECKFSVIDFGFPNQCNTRKGGQKRKNHSTNISDSHALSSRQLPSTTIDGMLTNFNEKLHHNVRPTSCHSINIVLIPAVQQHAALYTNPIKEAVSLRHQWNIQGKLRRRGKWIPNGHLTGQWKPPQWAITLNTHNVGEGDEYYSNNETNNNTPMKKKQKTRKTNLGGSQCKKSLLPQLDSLMWKFTSEMRMSCKTSSCEDDGSPMHSYSSSTCLRDVICPQYVKPTITVLCSAHSAMESLLPKGDCEEWEVVALAWRYYNHWRPSVTKVILLAESHAFTSKECANGPGFGMLQDRYFGPREFVSLVYCLAYGENESLHSGDDVIDKTNKGTPQFWTLLAACARGVDYVAKTATTTSTKTKVFSSPFASDLLKGGGLPVEERLQAKLKVLEDLRSRGIWLLDASIFGWYISQPQEYSRSSVTGEVHRKQKNRPPKELKIPSLVLSWELFTKHIIKEVADEGHLKLLIPIGMEVESALTRKRMEDVVVGGTRSTTAVVSDTFPAPNAWIPGGYGRFHAKLAALVNEATGTSN